MKKLWVVLNDSDDVLDYVEARSAEAAVKAFARKAGVPKEDIRWLYAIPADGVRDDVEVPGWLISALEYGPEFAFGPEESSPEAWEEYRKAEDELRARGIELSDIVGWVRTNSAFELWAPVVK